MRGRFPQAGVGTLFQDPQQVRQAADRPRRAGVLLHNAEVLEAERLPGLRRRLAEAVFRHRDPGALDYAAAFELVEAHRRCPRGGRQQYKDGAPGGAFSTNLTLFGPGR